MNELNDYLSKTPSSDHWKKIGVKPHHGIVLPLFSLRSEKSSGIGEYLDLIQVIDWCKDIGFDVIQLLPLNEPSSDSSPYNAVSSCALNPMHISLHALKGINNSNKLKEKLNAFKIFNTFPKINYSDLKQLKTDFLKEYYLYVIDDLKNDKDFQEFIKKHHFWLEEYCLFRSIQDEQNYKMWDLWPEDLKNINEKNISLYKQKYQESMTFYSVIQYFCFTQLQLVKKHADDKNVFLLGDVPILLSKNSCDVWYNKSLFDLNCVAGVPPDAYNKYGQKWNFPLFNWDQLNKTNYYWWKRRLHVIADLYHMYRIDHVVGFFRIWSVPLNKYAKEGQFIPQDPVMWEQNGKERLLMMLNASSLLPIGEDLGSIPQIVYYALRELGICGTKVVFWQKASNNYVKFNEYDSLSLITLSTHDSYTFQGWWENYIEDATKFAESRHWSYNPRLSYSQRKELLQDVHKASSIFHINLLQEYLALYPELIWSKTEDERINVPGTIKSTNWSYRFKPSFENIVAHKELQKDLKEILS
jgi:4-alpha-glucanotransferase